jgi:GTP-binding protein Era
MPFRSGFVCILGRPNAGKSTLLNALAGEKLAIVTPKPQTTRNRIQGIVNLPAKKKQPGAQIILIDTPGIHKPDSALGRKMMIEVREALDGCDLVLLIADATQKGPPADDFVLTTLKQTNSPVFLLLNKVDRLDKQKLLPQMEQASKLFPFREIIPLSALKRQGLEVLLELVLKNLPAGKPYFPEDEITDQPARFLAAEVIREQILFNTGNEVPYSTTVIIDQFEETPRLTRIAATIYCERDGQKRILVGHGGQMLKKVGTRARLDIERMLGTKVFLELFVKVRPGWRNQREFVEGLDWRRQLEKLVSTE